MKASADDERAMKAQLAKVEKLAGAATLCRDTTAIKGALMLVREAVITAYALANAIEDNTRQRAAEDLASALASRQLESV